MNTKSNITEAGRGASVVRDFSILETPLHDLHSMADVSATLLEDALGSSHIQVTGHADKYYLDRRQIDRMLFAAYQTQKMASALIDLFCDIQVPSKAVQS